jgi:hypothetical protein
MRYLYSYLLVFLAYSCVNLVSDKDLVSYILKEKHGLLKEINIKGYSISALYYPNDFFIKRDYQARSKESLDSIIKRYNKYMYFIINIKYNNDDIFSALNQVNNTDIYNTVTGFLESAKIIAGKKEIALTNYNINRYYNSEKATDILLVFPRDELEKNSIINLELDGTDLNIGKVKFGFSIKDIHQQPRLKIK